MIGEFLRNSANVSWCAARLWPAPPNSPGGLPGCAAEEVAYPGACEYHLVHPGSNRDAPIPPRPRQVPRCGSHKTPAAVYNRGTTAYLLSLAGLLPRPNPPTEPDRAETVGPRPTCQRLLDCPQPALPGVCLPLASHTGQSRRGTPHTRRLLTPMWPPSAAADRNLLWLLFHRPPTWPRA